MRRGWRSSTRSCAASTILDAHAQLPTTPRPSMSTRLPPTHHPPTCRYDEDLAGLIEVKLRAAEAEARLKEYEEANEDLK